jgi:hypothetical protein
MAILDAADRQPAQRQFASPLLQVIKRDGRTVRFLSPESQIEM